MRASTVLLFCAFSSAFFLIFSACIWKVRKTNQYRKRPPAPLNLTCRRGGREITNYMKGNFKYAWKITEGVRIWKDRCWQDQSLQFTGCLHKLTVFSSMTAYMGRSVKLKGIPGKKHWGNSPLISSSLAAKVSAGETLVPWELDWDSRHGLRASKCWPLSCTGWVCFRTFWLPLPYLHFSKWLASSSADNDHASGSRRVSVSAQQLDSSFTIMVAVRPIIEIFV